MECPKCKWVYLEGKLCGATFFGDVHTCRAKQDAVKSPSHYTSQHLETIYVIHQVLGPAGFKVFCMGNYIKYMERHSFKNGPEDLAKADQYLQWAVNGLPPPVNGMHPR